MNKQWLKEVKMNHYAANNANFEVVKMMTFLNEPWNTKSEEAKAFAVRHYFNVVSDIYVELKAIK